MTAQRGAVQFHNYACVFQPGSFLTLTFTPIQQVEGDLKKRPRVRSYTVNNLYPHDPEDLTLFQADGSSPEGDLTVWPNC